MPAPARRLPDVPETTHSPSAPVRWPRSGLIGSLSTHSLKFPGYPFGSMMPYAVDQLGRPVFFISSMAMHTQNLHGNERASLLITLRREWSAQIRWAPLASTLVGAAKIAPADEVREACYMSRHESARYWQDFADFAYYRLEVEGVYFIGGFGVMGWVPAADYAAAAPDPLATVAPDIIQHMNADHADALRRIAAHDSGETPDEASMTAVDRLGFHVRLKTGDRVHGRRIAFPREVTSTQEARTVLIEMVRACG